MLLGEALACRAPVGAHWVPGLHSETRVWGAPSPPRLGSGASLPVDTRGSCFP